MGYQRPRYLGQVSAVAKGASEECVTNVDVQPFRIPYRDERL